MEALGNLLPRALEKHVAGANRPVVEILSPLWPRVVGKHIGRFSRPAAFTSGTLTVAASSAAWAAQLKELAQPIRARINGALGAPVVKRLRVREERPPAGRIETAARFRKPEVPAAIAASEPGLRTDLGERLWAESSVTLPPALAEVVERSFVKYFSRPKNRTDA